jgi:hypothetical protein
MRCSSACRRPAWIRSIVQAQSTATSRAAQICRMRSSAKRPSLCTRTATETLSTESRLTAQRLGTGSSPGSNTTSLLKPRTVVVQGPTSVRRSRGMAASRERTTTGRRPISANSHHHTSPRAGRAFTRPPPPPETPPDRPIRRARRAGACRRPRSWRQPHRPDAGRAELRGPHQSEQHRLRQLGLAGRRRAGAHQLSYSRELEPCHDYATSTLHIRRSSFWLNREGSSPLL